jgi:hypothetical protein
MTGQKLIDALARMVREKPDRPIQFCSDGLAPIHVSPAMATQFAATGLYTASGTGRRIKEIWLTPPVATAPPKWQECWRNTMASAFPVPAGYDPRTKGGIGV